MGVGGLPYPYEMATRGYLLNDDVPDVAPLCELCNNAILTIKHITGEGG